MKRLLFMDLSVYWSVPMKKTIPIFWPSYHGKDIQRELGRLFPANMSNRWLGQAHKVDEFEKEFGKKFGYKYCVSVNSGSAALELAYHLVGIGQDDEVIVTVLTCTATTVHLVRHGAKIIFADIKEDLTIDPEDVARKITKKTKAIVAVTLGGIPVDKRIFALGKKHKIPVIVDCAQSVGAVNEPGDYLCYSFQAIKHFTTGDGGMLVVRNKKEDRRARLLRWFGIDREKKIKANWKPYQKRHMTMDIEEPGYKFQMNDIAATLGLVGLANSDRYLKHRQAIADYYRANLQYPTISGGTDWIFGILVDDRDRIADQLERAGIETNMVHLRNDIFKPFGGKRWRLPMMNRLEPLYLYIPIHTNMTVKDAKYITTILNKIRSGHLS